jgi:putative N6-adenine-specific DNA methylase
MRWHNFDEKLYETIYESCISRIKNDKVEIIANDIDAPTLKKAITNTKNAKVDDVVTCTNQSFFDITPSRSGGVIILNPPYGERIPLPEEQTVKLYKEIGNKLKKDFKGFTAWIITSSPEAINSIGLRPSRRIHLFNGSLECRYLKFELYDGSKKASKNPDTMTRR